MLIDTYKKQTAQQPDTCWVIAGDFNASWSELAAHKGIARHFINAFSGPTRPSGNQVDTILLDQRCSADMTDKIQERSKILTDDKFARDHNGDKAQLCPDFDDCIRELLDAHVDHYPLFMDL